MDAADEMYRIEAAYEAEPGLTPLLSIELTPVHDPGRCRQRRLAAALANVGPAVRAARDLLLAFGIEPDMGDRDPARADTRRPER